MRFTLYYRDDVENGELRKYKRYFKSEKEALKACKRFQESSFKQAERIRREQKAPNYPGYILVKLVQEELVLKVIKETTFSD